MLQRAKLLLILFVLAALPLRGYAGALMQLCGDGHHGQASVVTQAAEHHSHPDAHAGTHADANGGGDVPQASAGHDHEHGGSCSACGDCCAGALGAPASTPFLDRPATQAIAFFGHPFSGITLENAERPPHPLAA
jgi:hypothetical protein